MSKNKAKHQEKQRNIPIYSEADALQKSNLSPTEHFEMNGGVEYFKKIMSLEDWSKLWDYANLYARDIQSPFRFMWWVAYYTTIEQAELLIS